MNAEEAAKVFYGAYELAQDGLDPWDQLPQAEQEALTVAADKLLDALNYTERATDFTFEPGLTAEGTGYVVAQWGELRAQMMPDEALGHGFTIIHIASIAGEEELLFDMLTEGRRDQATLDAADAVIRRVRERRGERLTADLPAPVVDGPH